ncbi:DUF2857 domain-containing protein [Klebsiella spallanzanii]|uniref:DUF2857 domain-containing protein n=1 Tax=Klebsiella spallanzanii TaxID=2587528 RepID=UPI00115BA46D|nr:DUF2857 domain-containing protein [Klebsiella spallanzanii]VUS42638.1 hypothetical protein SB6419_00550 [Klebsiella spallanzanii]
MIDTINQAVLSQVIQELKKGNVRYCEALGFNFDELSELNVLTLDELIYLSRSSVLFINISINHEILNKMIIKARQERVFQQIINKSIMLGGSISLINHYFGLPAAEISARRRLMNIKVRQGRNQKPDVEDEVNLWNRWQEIRVENINTIEALEAMMRLAEESMVSLAA